MARKNRSDVVEFGSEGYEATGMMESDVFGNVTGDDINAYYEEQARLDTLTPEERQAEFVEAMLTAELDAMSDFSEKENEELKAVYSNRDEYGFECFIPDFPDAMDFDEICPG